MLFLSKQPIFCLYFQSGELQKLMWELIIAVDFYTADAFPVRGSCINEICL